MTTSPISNVRSRIWVLLAIDSCDRAGLTPIQKLRFHRLIFLSNCLAELFATTPPSKQVLKYRRGPFYPDVQWEIDRLVTMGLVSLSKMTIEPDKFGPWMEAEYGITSAGMNLISKVKMTNAGTNTATYIDELVFAFSRVHESQLSDVALHELNYAKPGVSNGALITFEDAESNHAIRKTEEFERMAPEFLARRTREKLQLYLRFIEAEAI